MVRRPKRITSAEVKKIIVDNFGDVDYLEIQKYLKLLELTGLNKINLSYHLRKLKIGWEKKRKKFIDSNGETKSTLDSVDVEEVKTKELTEEEKAEIERKNAEKAKTEREKLVEKVFGFLSRARTLEAVESKFGEEGLKIFEEFQVNSPEDFTLKEGISSYQQKTYYFERVVNGCVEVKERVFTVRHSENDNDYLAITFPQDLDFSKNLADSAIRIIPIDSVTFGDHLCDLEAFQQVLLRAATKPYVFVFLNGNIIGGSLYNKYTAEEYRRNLRNILAPVAHKILWAQSGDRENKYSKIDGIEPLRSVCRDLGIHHTFRPVRADIYWKDPMVPIEFYALHGRSGARLDGSKLNAVLKVTVNQNFPHFTIMGHLEEAIIDDAVVFSADPTNNRIRESIAYSIICPGFRKFAGSIREIKGYAPPVSGRVECIIYSDNTFEATH
ncbi:MAG: hypothetical protein L3J07_02035 [Candidatus Magasanikbacteria bacterium]|nr:hypothetical protein [Candidatus Magasanikbacteria bacterium]